VSIQHQQLSAHDTETNRAQTNEKAVFFPNLDGLRFLCFLSVFLYHSGYTEFASNRESALYGFLKHRLFGNGNLGVNCFFVLSGFLITYLLLEERRRTGRIDIGSFYLRRILRIWPLYYLCVAFGFVAFPALKLAFGAQPQETARPLFYLAFLSNFDFIHSGLPDASVLGILWSVAIEEQFYLAWPLLLAVARGASAGASFASVVVVSWLYRATIPRDSLRLELHTLAVISDMAVGGWAAHATLYRPRFLDRVRGMGRGEIAALYTAAFAVLLFRNEVFAAAPLRTVDRLVIAGLFALIILEQNYAERSFFKLGRSAVLSRLGTYTYGLYCLHPVAILVVLRMTALLRINTALWQVLLLEPALSLVLSVLFAYVSHRWFESPFLRMKSRFQRVVSA